MKQSFALLYVLLFLLVNVSAKRVNQNEARQIASEFLQQRKSQNLQLSLLVSDKSEASRMMMISGISNPYYIFNVGTEEGFVIVSADDAAGTVLGYADNGSFSLDNAPENIRFVMDMMAVYVKYAAENNIKTASATNGTPVVGPLLGNIEWNQMYPYNLKCPEYKTEDGMMVHYPTGCVVTAITQIMRYHKYPAQGIGSETYYFKGQDLVADYGNTQYLWDDMLEQYAGSDVDARYTDPVATLMAHMGIATKMQYKANGSGTYDPYVPEALINHFGYDKSVSLKYRNFYTTTEWMQIITDELDNSRPIYYGGQSTDGIGGHAFVCDGYDTNGFVHINWGWGGSSNGWFAINHLDPSVLGTGGGYGGFNRNQSMIVGIQPACENSVEGEWPLYSVVGMKMTFYSDVISVFMDVTSHRAKDFNGSFALAIMNGDEIVRLLDEQTLALKGFPADDNTTWYDNRNISRTTDVVDGTYVIRPVFKQQGSDTWSVLRCYLGTPAYCDITVKNGFISGEDTGKRAPNVDLLTNIVPQTPVFVGGYAKYKATIRVNDNDNSVQNMTLVLTNTEDECMADTIPSFVCVYDGSTEDVIVGGKLRADIEPGKYYVDAYSRYNMDGEQDKFNDAFVGRSVVEVLPASEYPVLALASPTIYVNEAGCQDAVYETEKLVATVDIINYATSGEASVIMYLVDKNNPEKRYVNVMNEEFFKSNGKPQSFMFYNPNGVNIAPGEYYIDFDVYCGNDTVKMFSEYEPTEITVLERTDCILHCEKLEGVPGILEEGVTYNPVITVTAREDYVGQVKVGLCCLDHFGGEPMIFEFHADIKAGETQEFKSKYGYTPSEKIETGSYLVYAKYKAKGEKHLSSMTGAANYYRYVTFGVVTAIDEIAADAGIVVRYNGSAFSVEGQNVEIIRTEVFSMDGCRVNESSLASGIYLLRVTTDKGTVIRKVRI